MSLVDALLAYVGGLLLGAAQHVVARRFGAAPDLAAVALGLLLTGRIGPRLAFQASGLLLGFSTMSLEPLGAWLLGGGAAAAMLLPLRAVVFVESPSTQAIFTLACAGSLAGARGLYALFEGGPPPAFARGDLAVVVPILRRGGVAAAREWRRLRDRVEARRRGGAAPSAT
jgi:hypothetical protein